jgi:lysyl-tRNA synthetase class 2
MLASVRTFFARRDVMEVDTPVLARAPATDPQIASFYIDSFHQGRPVRWFLQSSPEFAMKRLLAAGLGDIYQLSKVFRDDEYGRWHGSEFTMIEWYRHQMTLEALINETVELIAGQLQREDIHRYDYGEAFGRHVSIDPHTATLDELRSAGRERAHLGHDAAASLSRSGLLDLLFSLLVQPALGGIVVISRYPLCQAALARVSEDIPHQAMRFEVFVDGVELANGYHELADPDEQHRRMMSDVASRIEHGLPEVPVDSRLVGALRVGIGDVCGVAVGFDRLLALRCDADSIGQVMPFEAACA